MCPQELDAATCAQHVPFSRDVTHGWDNGWRQLRKEGTLKFADCLHNISYEQAGQAQKIYTLTATGTAPSLWNWTYQYWPLLAESACCQQEGILAAKNYSRHSSQQCLFFRLLILRVSFSSFVVLAIQTVRSKIFHSWTSWVVDGTRTWYGSYTSFWEGKT